MTTISTEEKAFRQFLRATFKARMACDENGNNITSLKGKTAKAEIRNGATVMEHLSEQCKLVKETAKGAVFAFKEGKNKSEISLMQVGDHHVLTMTSK